MLNKYMEVVQCFGLVSILVFISPVFAGDRYTNNYYYNELFNIEVNLAKGWEFSDISPSDVNDSLDKIEIKNKKQVINALDKIHILNAYPIELGDSNDPDSLVVSVFPVQPEVTYGKYLAALFNGSIEHGMQPSLLSRSYDYHVNGAVFYKARVNVLLPNGYDLRAVYLLMKKGDKMLFVQYSHSQDDFQYMEKMISRAK